MVEKANVTKRLASSEKSANPSKAKPVTTAPKSTELVNGSDKESESEESSEEDDDDEELQEAIYQYQPPENFTPLSSGSPRDSNPFSAANLKGKEIWFITAPRSAPLSRLSAVSALDVAKGNPVFESKSGRSYCLKSDEDAQKDGPGVTVMVPDSKGIYRAAGKPITKSFRVVESLPTPPEITRDQIPNMRPVRLQPEGLRMRYIPFGADDTGMNDAAADIMDLDKNEVTLAEQESPERKKKRQKSTEDGEKKKKKHRSKEKGSKVVKVS